MSFTQLFLVTVKKTHTQTREEEEKYTVAANLVRSRKPKTARHSVDLNGSYSIDRQSESFFSLVHFTL
jgi:hypothetical protein